MFSISYRLCIIALIALAVSCAPSPTPTPVPTATPLPPTATPVPPTATPTNTPIPPTATIAPTATATRAGVVGILANPQIAPAGIKGDAASGTKLFHQIGIECDSCHDNTKPFPGGEYAPNLGNIAVEAERVIKLPNYTGKAKSAAEYFRESILAPNVYLVPGDEYREKDGTSAMEQHFAEKLTAQQVEDLVAYLLTLNGTTTPPVTATLKGDAANGAKLFVASKIQCDYCHEVTKPYPGGDYAPNLANIATAAEKIIKSPSYTGKAKTVEDFLRESITNPNAYLEPGPDDYRNKDGSSAMDSNLSKTLTPQELEDLIAYLMTLK